MFNKGKPIVHYDPNFGMDLSYFDNKAVFIQKLETKSVKDFLIEGTITYMTCDDERCLPPEDFDFVLPIKMGTQPKVKEPVSTIPPSWLKKQDEYDDDAKESNDEVASNASTGNKTDLEELSNVFGEESGSNEVFDVEDAIQWKYSAEKINDTEYDLVMTANLANHWHLYSQHLAEDAIGPIPTAFTFKEEGIELIGNVKEPTPIIEFEPAFEIDVKFFKDQVEFRQRIKVLDEKVEGVKGEVEFMVCSNNTCLFSEPYPIEIYFDNRQQTPKPTGLNADENDKNGNLSAIPDINLPLFDLNTPVSTCGEEISPGSKSGGMNLLWGFLGGLVALLTPCVFQMVPLTVSFFTKMSDGPRRKGIANATWYGVSIALIYGLLTLPFHLMDGADPEIFNSIASGVGMNIFFFLLLMFFAFSFFGYYDIALPSKWTNKVDSASNVGGAVGIFLMGLTLVIVSFTCTGAILGSVLGTVMEEGPWPLTFAFVGFGLGLGVPFALFAMFPSWLNSLPKSGGWLNTVKVTLGFIELGLALKFLSTADLVKQWGLLPREVFIGLWILITAGLVLYLLGKIKFPHDSPIKKISKGRWTTAFLAIAFIVYLIPGLTNTEYANLRLLSGIAPKLDYTIYENGWYQESREAQELKDFDDFNTAFAYSKKMNKPILIDFTGWSCANCRRMEETVWVEPEVEEVMKNYVLVSLYVDDKRELPMEEQTVIEVPKKNGFKKKKIKTIGNKWHAFELLYFKNASQPHYALMSPDGRLLNTPVSGMTHADEYKEFLECGLDAMDMLDEGMAEKK